jgi:hypothetical protein
LNRNQFRRVTSLGVGKSNFYSWSFQSVEFSLGNDVYIMSPLQEDSPWSQEKLPPRVLQASLQLSGPSPEKLLDLGLLFWPILEPSWALQHCHPGWIDELGTIMPVLGMRKPRLS